MSQLVWAMAVSDVLTALAFAQLVARQTHVEALTVFFLALCLPTIASFFYSSVDWIEVGLAKTMFCYLPSLLDLFTVLSVVGAISTSTMLAAGEPRRKTLTVHFEAACLLAAAACFLRSTDVLSLLNGHFFRIEAGADVVPVTQFLCLNYHCFGLLLIPVDNSLHVM